MDKIVLGFLFLDIMGIVLGWLALREKPNKDIKVYFIGWLLLSMFNILMRVSVCFNSEVEYGSFSELLEFLNDSDNTLYFFWGIGYILINCVLIAQFLVNRFQKKMEFLREKKEYKEKNEAVYKEEKQLDNKIERYRIIQNSISCNEEEMRTYILVCGFLDQIDKSGTKSLGTELHKYVDLYKEKKQIQKDIEKVALKYIKIDNVQAAENLMKRIGMVLNHNELLLEKESDDDLAKVQLFSEPAILPSKDEIRIRNVIKFGIYPQDENGKEKTPIEWVVLDKKNEKALLISRYTLDCKKYNEKHGAITWENCSLRKWLNESFFNNAFRQNEQDIIKQTTVTAEKNPGYGTNPGNDTNDKIFLLSIQDAYKYSIGKCKPTAYATSCGASSAGNGNCWWWLRSPGSSTNDAACVDYFGYVISHGDDIDRDYIAVRPALWIDLESCFINSKA